MHKLRKALAEGSVPVLDVLTAEKSLVRQKRQRHLSGETIHRNERRQTHQRNEQRYPVEDLRALATWRNETSELRVVNLSSNGLQVETAREADIGEAIEIALQQCDPVECFVRWIRDGRFGLEFSAETRLLTEAGVVEYVLDNISRIHTECGEPVDRRLGIERRGRAMRHGLVWLGELSANDDTVPVMLRNISQTGAMLHLDVPIEVCAQDACKLDLGEAGVLPAVVQWAAGEEIGIKFNAGFDISLLTRHGAADVDLFGTGEHDEHGPVTQGSAGIGRLLRRKPWEQDWGDVDEEQVDGRIPGIGPPTLRELYDTLYPGRDRPSALGSAELG